MGYTDHIDDKKFDLETFVCINCVSDSALQTIVRENLTSNTCTYCNLQSFSKVAAPFELVMSQIYCSICQYYEDAASVSLPYDGGWTKPEKEINDILEEFDPGWGDKFREDILSSIGYNKYWISHSDYNWSKFSPYQTLKFSWHDFKKQVMHKTRYIFLSEPIDKNDTVSPDHIPVAHFLDNLGELIKKFKLVKKVDAGLTIYRARALDKNENCRSLKDISVPPKEKTKSGRMNPAGIPYFYIACEASTAKKEANTEEHNNYCLGKMKTKQAVILLNLCDLPIIPSIFEPDKYDERNYINFLYNFKKDISRPISHDEQEHINYVPTQIISEYFRHKFLYNKQKIDGIMFNSAVNKKGINITFFVSEHKEVEELVDLYNLSTKCS